MNLKNIKEQLEQMTEEWNAKKRSMATAVAPLLREFLNENPEVKGFCWTQYTPYFNDGETCEFSVNEPCFYFTSDETPVGEDHYEFELPYSYDSSYAGEFREKCSLALYAKCKDLADTIYKLDDVLEAAFGDHCLVIVTRDGIEVEEYSHD